MEKKLYKSVKDRKLAGVCGGIAEYFDIDSSIVRILWLIVIFCAGTGILVYIICAIVLTDNPNIQNTQKELTGRTSDEKIDEDTSDF